MTRDTSHGRITAAAFAVALLGLTVPAHAQCAGRAPSGQRTWDISNAHLAAGSTPTVGAVALGHGIACRADLSMRDGVIDFELAPARDTYAGIAFRMGSALDYELIVFRPGEAGRWLAAQYYPVRQGAAAWQLYPGEGYEGDIPAHAAVTPDGWLPVRIVVSGRRADVIIAGDTTPVLRVKRLVHESSDGPIGLWTQGGRSDTAANASIRALRTSPAGETALAPLAERTAPAGQVMRWRISRRFDAPDSIHFADRLSRDVERALRDGGEVAASASGLMDLTTLIGNPAGPQAAEIFNGAGWGVAYARVSIRTATARTRRLGVTYSDAIGVYLDGVLLYEGDERIGARNRYQLGSIGEEAEQVVLRLHPGANELVIAVADKAFGWGFRARLDSLEGLRVTP